MLNESRSSPGPSGGASHKPYGVDGLFPVQRTADVHQPFGTDKSVPYAHDWLMATPHKCQKPHYTVGDK